MHLPQTFSRFLLPVEHEVVEVLLQAAIELRDKVEGGTELGAGADEPARRPDQAKHRRRLRERLSRPSPERASRLSPFVMSTRSASGLRGHMPSELVDLLPLLPVMMRPG